MLPGTGYGHDPTRVSFESDHDRITGINVVGSTDFDTQLKIREALDARLKTKAIQDPNDSNVWTWKSKPPVKLDASGAARFSVQIGQLQ